MRWCLDGLFFTNLLLVTAVTKHHEGPHRAVLELSKSGETMEDIRTWDTLW